LTIHSTDISNICQGHYADSHHFSSHFGNGEAVAGVATFALASTLLFDTTACPFDTPAADNLCLRSSSGGLAMCFRCYLASTKRKGVR